MTSHKHSFQCFDTVVEKPSFTAGHKFALPGRSSFTSTNLEQPENRRCSLCSESHQTKQVTSEVSENQPAFWYSAQNTSHQHTPRKPMRPEGDPGDSVAHHHHNQRHQCHIHRHCKRIVLVKNSNPSIQKTILLHCKPVHSLSVFMDDVSELMHCLIRKLYTLDGCKVDSIQSLLQGPGVLVCVGRESFHPLFMDGFQKNSEDKLPKLILKPQSNTCKEDQGYKKNVNIGVKPKKSPRPFPKARSNLLDDDVKKRVLVSKDGSLSMEMKLQFRLLNDETLHCSTEIKKSSCTFNVTFPGKVGALSPHSSHGESCSEAEALSASDADDVCVNKLHQTRVKEPHCQHCCARCEDYDAWNNPVFSEQEILRHSVSSCSSAPSQKIRSKKDSVDSVCTASCEEYAEHVEEKETCIQQTVVEGESGDSIVRYCTVSRCCSRSGMCSFSAKAKKAHVKRGGNDCAHACTEDVPAKKIQNAIESERPLSAETNSSDILATFKEGECGNSTRTSRASQCNGGNDERERNVKVSPYTFTPCKPLESPKQSLSSRASSTASCCSVTSKSFRRFVVRETQETADQDKNNAPSSPPHRCQHKELADVAMETGISQENLKAISQSEDDSHIKSDIAFDSSKTCDDISGDTVEPQANKKGPSEGENRHLSNSNDSFVAEQDFLNSPGVYAPKDETTFADSDPSQSPLSKNKPEEASDGTCDENIASSPKSNVSGKSSRSRFCNVACTETGKADLQNDVRSQSEMSVYSSASITSKQSTVSEGEGIEDHAGKEMPCASTKPSQSSQTKGLEASELTEMEELFEERSPSIMSVKSTVSEAASAKLAKEESSESLKSTLSNKTNISVELNPSHISAGTLEDMDNGLLMERVPSHMHGKPDVSKTSHVLDISPSATDGVKNATENRAPSATSDDPNIASRSTTPLVSSGSPEGVELLEEETLKRPSRVRSSKSAASVRSAKSKTRDGNGDNAEENTEQVQKRSVNAMPSNSSDSCLSKTSKISEAMQDKSDDFNQNTSEEQDNSTQSSTPTKSDILETVTGDREERPSSKVSSFSQESEKSMISQAAEQNEPIGTRAENIMSRTGMEGKKERSQSAMSSKSTECALDAAQERDRPGNRPPSVMSCATVTSTKSAVSDVACENEEDEPKHIGQRSQNASPATSRTSRKSKASKKDTDTDKIERAPSSISCKSVHSDRSNLTPHELDTGPAYDSIQESDAYEKTKGQRAECPIRSNSRMSCLSNKSNEQTQDRALTPVSAKSNVSSKSSRAKQSAARTPSPLCAKSDQSKPYMEKSVIERFEEPQNANKEETVARSPSALSAKSNTSARSKKSDTQSNRTMTKLHLNPISPETRTSANAETLNLLIPSNHTSNVDAVKCEETCDVKIEERAESSMSTKSSVSSRSLKSNISALSAGQTDTIHFNTKSDIALSGLKISMTDYSNNPDNEERASSALSKSSNASSVHRTCERVLTPASASVSIGIVEEYDADNVEDTCCKDLSNEKRKHGRTQEATAKSLIVSDISRKSDCTSFQVILDDEVENNTKKSSKKSSNHAYAKCHIAGERSKSNLSSYRRCQKDMEATSRPRSADIPAITVSGKKSTGPVISLCVSNHRSNASKEKNNKLNATRDLNGSLVATDCSKNDINNQSEKNSNSSYRLSNSALAQRADKNSCDLVPANLPSSSPTEVVNEWLEKIPLDSALYDVGDEFHENSKEEETLKRSGEAPQNERGSGSDEQNVQPGDDMKDPMQKLAVEENVQPGSFPQVPSSVRLMKILLSPKLDRCNSLPEVSPVYGRKLSTSARGFLDSLVKLHLLDFDPSDVNGKSEKYNDLMNTLQSLWLRDPSDGVTIVRKCNKQYSMNEKYNMTLSSGVDLNSSSQDSGKSSANASTVAQKSQTNTAGDGTEVFRNVQDTDTNEKTFHGIETTSDPATPDIASRIRWTPENEAEENMQIASDLTDNYPPDTASISKKSCRNDSTGNQALTDHEEEQTAQSTETDFDPDPVWVLNLLNKIEKQFMTHYVTAMAEVKVRWNLSDNEQLDIMIRELRDEVHKRIQVSINNELRKMQGRPKPPKESISRESTNQRRRRLKLSLNQSVDQLLKAADDEDTNDDEFCPCDTCMKKKASPRSVLAMDDSNSAPKILDFDLRNILHLKRNPPSNGKESLRVTENEEQMSEGKKMPKDVLHCSFRKEAEQEREHEVQSEENGSNAPDVPDANIHLNKYEMVEGNGPVGDEGQNTAFEAGIDDNEDVTAVESSRDVTEKKESLAEGTSEGNEGTEGEMSESEGGEISSEENKKHADAEPEVTWQNTPEQPDTAVERDLTEVEEDHKSDGIAHLEDGTIKDDTAEAEKSESTDAEQRDGNDSAEEDVYKKQTSKENIEGDVFDEEKVSEPTEDRAELESVEGNNGINDDSAKEGGTDSDELDGEGTETSEDREASRDDVAEVVRDMGETEAKADDDSESGEATKTSNAQTADDTSDDEIEEGGEACKATETEISGDGTAADEKGDDVMAGDAENRDDSETPEIEEAAFNETVDSGNATQAKTAECDEEHDSGTSGEGESVEGAVVEDEESDEAAEENGNYKKEDESAEEPDESNSDLEEKIADNEIDKRGETLESKDVKQLVIDKTDGEDGQETDNEKTANAMADETTDSVKTSQSDDDDDDDDETADDDGDGTSAGTPNNNTFDIKAEDRETPDDNTFDDETTEDRETPKKNTAEDSQALDDDDTAGDGPSEDGETPNDEDGAAEDGQTLNNHSTVDGATSEDGEAQNNDTADDGASEDGETANDNTTDDGAAEDGQTLQDDTLDETAEERETPNDNVVDDGTAEDDDTADDGPSVDKEADEETIEEGTVKDENMEEVDEMTETRGDNGSADGQAGDDPESKAENEETAEAKTEEDGETADCGAGSTLAPNGVIAKQPFVNYATADDNDSDGETNERTEVVINTQNPKTKQNSEIMHLIQGTCTPESLNANIPAGNTGESHEGGDEAEDDTEPVVETYGRAPGIKFPDTHPKEWPLCKDDHATKRTIASFESGVKMYTSSEDGEDADGEDSETEVHNKDGVEIDEG